MQKAENSMSREDRLVATQNEKHRDCHILAIFKPSILAPQEYSSRSYLERAQYYGGEHCTHSIHRAVSQAF